MHTGEMDVLLSDVKMPHMDGLALLRHIKAHASGVVVVMMPGYHEMSRSRGSDETRRLRLSHQTF